MSDTPVRRYLYDQLSPAAQRLAAVPRIGNLIGCMSPERAAQRFSGNATEADVFWEVYTYIPNDETDDCGILRDGLKVLRARKLARRGKTAPKRRHQVNRACDLLGAIAFEMYAQVDEQGQPAPAFGGLNADRANRAVLKRFRDAGALVTFSGLPETTEPAVFDAYFENDWNALLEMDSHALKHFIFSTDEKDEEIRWTDVTTMAFFAAYWACRWATSEELKQTLAWVVDSLKGTNGEYIEFWRFAAEMPEEALAGTHWVDLFASLYDFSLTPIRSTEFIYRSWERMEKWSPETIALYKREFQALLATRRGERSKIANELLAGFVPLVKTDKAKDTGTFTMGAPPGEDRLDLVDGRQDNPQHSVTLTRYYLHRYCVMNEEYELFDPRHKVQRWRFGAHPDEKIKAAKKGKGKGADDRCPVVNVTWYDAFCFAKWLGTLPVDNVVVRIELPTEAQWEYGCRAGKVTPSGDLTPFTFHEGHNGLSCTPDICNFDGKYPFPKVAELPLVSKAVRYRQRTLAVDMLLANPWGLHQLHGNVWEWCMDWYSERFYESDAGSKLDPVNQTLASNRVIRGGSWSDPAGTCRSGTGASPIRTTVITAPGSAWQPFLSAMRNKR